MFYTLTIFDVFYLSNKSVFNFMSLHISKESDLAGQFWCSDKIWSKEIEAATSGSSYWAILQI